MGNHALLSPSSSHRWLSCTPSAVLETEFENKSSNAAEEGTAFHALCEHKLKKALRRRSKRPVSAFNTDEMEEHSDGYVEFVLEQLEKAKQTCPDPLVLIEQKVDLSDFVPGSYGTADCLMVSDDTLHIIDAKYGLGVLVDAERNTQLMCYGIAALGVYESLYDIKEVSLSIFQPRRENVQTWTVSVEELKTWAETELKPKAQMAAKGEGEYCPGEWCQFCRAAVKCRARAAEKLRIAEEEFKLPPLLTDEEIESILPMLPDITKWANEISAYALEAALNHGKEWSGFKVVEGRSNRKFSDEDAVAAAAKEHGYTDIYRQSLITLTEMQKLMGKKQFEEILGGLVIKPPGKPTLVPLSDSPVVWKTLSIDNSHKQPQLVFKSSKNLHASLADNIVRHKLVRFLRDKFCWPQSERIEFYDDFLPYSFTFKEYRGGKSVMTGGLILHNQDDRKKARYSIHT